MTVKLKDGTEITPIMVGDRCLIREDNREEVKKSAGGIVFPDQAQRKLTQVASGIVLAVGPGAHWGPTGERIDTEIQIGSQVWFPENVGSEVYLGGETLHVIRERDLLLMIER